MARFLDWIRSIRRCEQDAKPKKEAMKAGGISCWQTILGAVAIYGIIRTFFMEPSPIRTWLCAIEIIILLFLLVYFIFPKD